MLQLLVIAYALFALIIVVALFSKKGHDEDNKLRRKKSIDKESTKGDYKNIDTSFYERVVQPFIDKVNKTDIYGKNPTKNVKKQKQNEAIALKLRKAGLHVSVSNFNFFKNAFAAVVIVLSFGISLVLYQVLYQKVLLILLIGVVIGVFGPNFYLSSQVKSHQNAIKAQLADTIDLMGVCMEAGLSFDAALVKISERMEGPFIDELMTVFKQIQLGKNRNEALKAMSDNTDIPELKTFVSAVIQANQMGIPITNVLQAQAEQLRMNKEEEIKEVAAKVPTKMTIPTVIFIMPTIFLIILGPVVFNVVDNLSGKF
jgi:tight adherence protein C